MIGRLLLGPKQIFYGAPQMHGAFYTPLWIASLIAFCLCVLNAYRNSSSGTYSKSGVAALAASVILLIGLRLLLECFWADYCSLQEVWPQVDTSVDNGWVEVGVIIGAFAVMMVYGAFVAATYALPPILAAGLTGMVVGRLIWLLRHREPRLRDDQNNRRLVLREPMKKRRWFGGKSK